MSKFEDEAKNAEQTSFFGEFLYFLKTSKKWWLTPIIVILLAFGILIILSGTALAPFIYTLF